MASAPFTADTTFGFNSGTCEGASESVIEPKKSARKGRRLGHFAGSSAYILSSHSLYGFNIRLLHAIMQWCPPTWFS